MALGNNPLLRKDKTAEKPVLTEEQVQQLKHEISDVDDFTTMSFKVRKAHLKKLRDYAFTNRLEIKEALDEALEKFLSGIDESTLMEYPEKPKKTRRRK